MRYLPQIILFIMTGIVFIRWRGTKNTTSKTEDKEE